MLYYHILMKIFKMSIDKKGILYYNHTKVRNFH